MKKTVILLFILTIFSGCIQQRQISEKYCEVDSDCACGIHKYTGDCFYGNKEFVDTSGQCPDYCGGIASNLVLMCLNNTCFQVRA